ncbi:MAG: CGNR zinc finger domain-containing protein [Nakamurella sp.]
MTHPLPDEDLLLALLNSTPVVDGSQRDMLTGRDAGTWLREYGDADSSVEQTRRARALLQDVVRGTVGAASLTPMLAGVRSVPQIDAETLAWTIRTPPGKKVAVRAILAWAELQRLHPGRLRACANDDCALFLIDHSKPNRARWCSMAVCGNRMKARRHYARTRSAGE